MKFEKKERDVRYKIKTKTKWLLPNQVTDISAVASSTRKFGFRGLRTFRPNLIVLGSKSTWSGFFRSTFLTSLSLFYCSALYKCIGKTVIKETSKLATIKYANWKCEFGITPLTGLYMHQAHFLSPRCKLQCIFACQGKKICNFTMLAEEVA